MSWASMNDVLRYTNVSATVEDIDAAQGIVELHADTSFEATLDSASPTGSKLSARDARLLRMAVSYQAAYINQQVGTFARGGFQSFSQDGLSVTAQPGDELAFVLAPLAKMALRELSWKRGSTGTLRVSAPRRSGSLSALEDAWLRDEDDATIWKPL